MATDYIQFVYQRIIMLLTWCNWSYWVLLWWSLGRGSQNNCVFA